jgi:hypothetical protein
LYPLAFYLRHKISKALRNGLGGFAMQRAPMLLSCLVVLLPSITALPEQARAEAKGADEPQMVWLTYAEGEVKFSPGHKGQPKLGKDWIAANVGQVIEDGYTLVTEKGRAEIEFEDGSVMYLADHSVLEFDSLLIHPNRMETDLALLTGKATVAHASTNQLALATPQVILRMVQPQTTTVESALDAVVVEATEGSQVIERGAWFGVLSEGNSVAYVKDHMAVPLPAKQMTAEEQEWDHWVAGRLTTRRAQIAEGLRASGMEEPIPGLAGMVANGKFFDCPPYGKCWQPIEPLPQASVSVPQASAGTATATNSTGTRNGNVVVNRTMLMRCPLQAWNATNNHGKSAPRLVQYGPCFAGSWDYSDLNRCGGSWDTPAGYWPWQDCSVYPSTWVAGRRHRHECHIVKVKGNAIGLVPRHPLDRPGHPPVNAKSGILVLTAEKGVLKAAVEPAPGKEVQEATSVPRAIQRGAASGAPHVAQPVIEAKMAAAILPKGTLSAQQTATMKNVNAVHFDFKSQNFVGRTGEGGASHSVVVAHASSGGSSGGGAHGSSGGGSSGGGSSGSHSGGGSSGGAASAGGGGGGHH